MKKFYRTLKRILIAGAILFIGLYLYTKYYWLNFANEIELIALVSEIKEAETLPEKFYELYQADYPNSLTYSLNRQIITGFFKSNIKKPPSSQVAILSRLSWRKSNSFDKRRSKLLEISLSWEIESGTTQKECLNWVMEKFDFSSQTNGIRQASQFYFEKEISELNDRELASLVIMTNNPSLYNPFRRKELLEQKVNELLKN